MSEHTTFSLSELNEHLKRVIDFNMRMPLWISCEIAEISRSKGTTYLSLVERNDGQITARGEAIIWNKSLTRMAQKLGDLVWSVLQIGRQILIQVQVEYHPYYGLKLSIQDIDPSITIGALELKRMQVLKQLQQEQFVGLNAQVPTAVAWQRIAIISSSKAAGLQDFLQQIKHNPHEYAFQYELFPAAVQGVNAAKEVRAQLEQIEARKEDFDCIAIVRGGGARLDLMSFDDYDLCVAIATCELPVLTGIGHDVDETLADQVAYQALKTPTAVADYLVNRLLSLETSLAQLALHIKQRVGQQVQQQQAQLHLLQQRLELAAQNRVQQAHQQLTQLEEKLHLLDPKTTLSRGFVLLTKEDGTLVYQTKDFEIGNTYTLHLIDGKYVIRVEEKG